MKLKTIKFSKQQKFSFGRAFSSAILIAIIAIGTTALISCGGEQQEKEKPKVVSTTITQEQATEILDHYLMVKDALVKTDGPSAGVEAEKLAKVVEGLEDEIANQIRFDAKKIAGTKDTGPQRDHFNTLSDNIYSLVKATGAKKGELYLQFCPMAFNDKGAYWVSAEKQVNNPYFGDQMLHCGSVKEEL